MNRKAFFDALRKSPDIFGCSLLQGQINVMEAILDQTAGLPIPHVAYILATAYHEPGPKSRMMPNRENLYYTSPARIAKVWPSRFTHASATAFTRSPTKLANHVYNSRLGNRSGSDDGWTFRGGGLDHLTGREHYQALARIVGCDLVANPDAILEPAVAVKSLVHGLTTGRYTGKCLADYGPRPDQGFDYVNARAIVNGDVKANGGLIAKYARAFEAALIAAGANERRQTTLLPPALPHTAPGPLDVPSTPALAQTGPAPPAASPAITLTRLLQILATWLFGQTWRKK